MLHFAIVDDEPRELPRTMRDCDVSRVAPTDDLTTFDGVVDLASRVATENAVQGIPVLTTARGMDDAQLDRLLSPSSQTTVAQPQRFSPYARSLRQEVDSGCLGSPGLVRIHDWQSRRESGSKERSPDFLWSQIVASLDVACWLLGDRPSALYARSHDQGGVPVSIHVQLRFSQAMAIVDAALVPGNGYQSLSVIGSTGAAYADDQRNTNLLLRDGCHGLGIPLADDWLAFQLDAFAQVVAGQVADESVEETKQALILSHAAIQSAASGQAAQREGDSYVLV